MSADPWQITSGIHNVLLKTVPAPTNFAPNFDSQILEGAVQILQHFFEDIEEVEGVLCMLEAAEYIAREKEGLINKLPQVEEILPEILLQMHGDFEVKLDDQGNPTEIVSVPRIMNLWGKAMRIASEWSYQCRQVRYNFANCYQLSDQAFIQAWSSLREAGQV